MKVNSRSKVVLIRFALAAAIGVASFSLLAPAEARSGALPMLTEPTPFGRKVLGSLGKGIEIVQKFFGATEIQKVAEYDYLKAFGADAALSYYGKLAMPDDYLEGLTFARSMTCFFDKGGCAIGFYGPAGGSNAGVLKALERELGLAGGTLKLGKALLTGKTTVKEINGGPAKMYAVSWGALFEIEAVWVSATARPPKTMKSSF